MTSEDSPGTDSRIGRRRLLELGAVSAVGFAGCSQSEVPPPTVRDAWGVVGDRTVVDVEFPSGVGTLAEGGIRATLDFEFGKPVQAEEVRRVDGRVYRVVAPGSSFPGRVETSIDLEYADATRSVSADVVVAPRVFTTEAYLGFAYGYGYPENVGAGVGKLADVVRAFDLLEAVRSDEERIRALAEVVGVGSREAGFADLLARLASLQRYTIGRISNPEKATDRASAYLPIVTEDGPLLSRETTSRYGREVAPVLTLRQGGGIESVTLELRTVPEGRERSSTDYEWTRAETGAYALLPFEPVSLPSDPTVADALELVPTYRERVGSSARIRLRRRLTDLPVATSLSAPFDTPKTGYNPETWMRRTNNGGVTRRAGDAGLRLASNPLAYVAIVSRARFGPPARLEFSVDSWKPAPDSGVFVGWFDPTTYLDDGIRIRPRKFVRDAVCLGFLESEVRLLSMKNSPLAADTGDPWTGLTLTGRPRERLDWRASPTHRFALEWTEERVTLSMDGDALFEHSTNVPSGPFPLYAVGGEWGGRDASLVFLDDLRVATP